MADKKSESKGADAQQEESVRSGDEEKFGLVHNPHASTDQNFEDDPTNDLDPAKVVGTYAMQPDPNDERPAPLPVVAEGMKEAPADDDDDTPAPAAPDAKIVQGG